MSGLLAALMIAATAPADEPGGIRGRVVDIATGEPVAEASVFVDSTNTAFRGGRMAPASGEHADGFAVTDSDGRFTLSNVPPGRRSVIAVYALGFINATSKVVDLAAGQAIEDVEIRNKALAVADAPLDPKRRRPAYSRVFYPGALDLAGGMALELRSGERREGIDFQLWREPSLCIEGKVIAPPEFPRLRVLVDQEEPGFGSTKRAGYFSFSLTDVLEGTREFRVCGMAAGSYRVRVHDEHGGTGLSVYGVASVLLVDRDVKGVQVVLASSRASLPRSFCERGLHSVNVIGPL
ncbi:MAG: carboxypeptidase-like regulatory domain-containing protein [Bryobacteraceae bacterium]